MLQRVLHTIQKHHLPAPPAKILVALSGGCDSVALAYILLQLGYQVEAAHCNFHLRGTESDCDEALVQRLCDQWGIRLHLNHFQTEAYAIQKGISIEMAARELRYSWFEELRQEMNCCGIAVAHHQDDNAETLLLNLSRGTGLRGLTGMKYLNGYVFRPLLDISRREIEQFLNLRNIEIATDSTNADTHYKRNFIRHDILPKLKSINPSIAQTLHNTTTRLSEALYLYEIGLKQAKELICKYSQDGITVDIPQLLRHPSAHTILHEVLSEYHFKASEIEMIFKNLKCSTGATFQNESHIATLHRDSILVTPIPTPLPPTPLPEMGYIQLPYGTLNIQKTDHLSLTKIPKESTICCIDADKVEGNLSVRTIINGDRFHPFGMKGSKLVSDYLTNLHYSIIDKRRAMVITDEKKILWLVGERPDDRIAITDATKNITRIEFTPTDSPT